MLADPDRQFLMFINGIETLDTMRPADPAMIAAGPVSAHVGLYFAMCGRVRRKLLDIEGELAERARAEAVAKAGRQAG